MGCNVVWHSGRVAPVVAVAPAAVVVHNTEMRVSLRVLNETSRVVDGSMERWQPEARQRLNITRN